MHAHACAFEKGVHPRKNGMVDPTSYAKLPEYSLFSNCTEGGGGRAAAPGTPPLVPEQNWDIHQCQRLVGSTSLPCGWPPSPAASLGSCAAALAAAAAAAAAVRDSQSSGPSSCLRSSESPAIVSSLTAAQRMCGKRSATKRPASQMPALQAAMPRPSAPLGAQPGDAAIAPAAVPAPASASSAPPSAASISAARSVVPEA
mmetsp:Transcript_66822/g.209056  ORF Transcript_66822/g.209056 Transcript_66822/m.209056 type:complete len:201 (-) Transcript_66822:3308-3910(-)